MSSSLARHTCYEIKAIKLQTPTIKQRISNIPASQQAVKHMELRQRNAQPDQCAERRTDSGANSRALWHTITKSTEHQSHLDMTPCLDIKPFNCYSHLSPRTWPRRHTSPHQATNSSQTTHHRNTAPVKCVNIRNLS